MHDLGMDTAVSHPLALYQNHLEFNGYRVEESETALICRHPRKLNLFLKPIDTRGVLVSTIYSFEEGLDRMQVLEYINQLNVAFIFMKAYVNNENNLILETFFEGDYDRTNFSILLENVEYDMTILNGNPATQNYLC